MYAWHQLMIVHAFQFHRSEESLTGAPGFLVGWVKIREKRGRRRLLE